MNFDNYKFRCSALGKIMSKSGKFTDGNKTYIQEVYIGEVHQVRKEISSKYFEKGLFEEESGITLLNKTLYPNSIVIKNKERKANYFIHGECDTIKDDIVYDIKNAWDLFTFGKADLTHDYLWQLKGYMYLWGKTKARLFYCLNNTPDHILCEEEKRLYWKGNFVSDLDEEYLSQCTELRKKHNYDSMPLEERFKIWDVELLESDIEAINEAVNKARTYMNELEEERQIQIMKNRELMGLPINILTIHEENLKLK